MTLGVVMAFWPALQMLRAKLAGSGPVPRAA
jgi:putative tricarboxylic transport membrane protein